MVFTAPASHIKHSFTAELEEVVNVPSILKLATEMFLKSAVIFKSGLDFSVKPKGYRDGRKSILPPL